MPPVQLVALKAFPYASGSIAAGEVFEVLSSFDATALIAARMATREDSLSEDDLAALIVPDGVMPVRRRRRARKSEEAE